WAVASGGPHDPPLGPRPKAGAGPGGVRLLADPQRLRVAARRERRDARGRRHVAGGGGQRAHELLTRLGRSRGARPTGPTAGGSGGFGHTDRKRGQTTIGRRSEAETTMTRSRTPLTGAALALCLTALA